MRMIVMSTVLAVALSGCGAAAGSGSDDGRIRVVTSLYPLAYVVQEVGGDAVTVETLTRPGVEPHDLELTPRDVAELADADLAVHLAGFQPAVDSALQTQGDVPAYDVTADARLLPAEGSDRDDAPRDPHFWLDPLRLADVADGVAREIGKVEPESAPEVELNAARLRSELEALDRELRDGLADCVSTDLVTTHAAFGYLADRYGFTQVALSGLSPEHEPSAADLARVADFVETHGVRTVYTEVLVSPAAAETIARETGARTAVLDPVEGLDESSAGDDYPSVMRANLAALRDGQPCR